MWRLAVVAIGVCLTAAGCGGGKKAGAEGGPCYGNGTCDPGLVCLSRVCVDLGQQDGAAPPPDGGPDGAATDAEPSDGPADVAPSDGAADAAGDSALPNDAAATDAVQTDAAVSYAGRIGSACTGPEDCIGADALCLFGFCTRPCGQGTSVTDCNDPLLSSPVGPNGGSYSCFPLGPGYRSLCWPNGSGAPCGDAGTACPRADEVCLSDRCAYVDSGTTRRTNMYCHRDQDCETGEYCALFDNLDLLDIRMDGVCLWGGDPPNGRLAAGAACSADADCGSLTCIANACLALCLGDGDCGSGKKCVTTGSGTDLAHELATSYFSYCQPWAGSRAACTSNAACASGEFCDAYEVLVSSDTTVAVAGACRAVPNPAASSNIGGACTLDAHCRSAECLVDPLTGFGYCSGPCFVPGDCGNGTECRLVTLDARDPATRSDDVRAGRCLQTGVGASCQARPSCKVCTTSADCAPTQGVTCVKASAGDLTGFCRDQLGRCAAPCRNDCTPGGPNNGGCPSGSTCVTYDFPATSVPYCRDANGGCVRADLDVPLVYEDGMCGDEEYPLAGGGPLPQQDLCYFYAQVATVSGPMDIFACGQACGGTCPDIAASGGPITTSCRTVYEQGVNLFPSGHTGGAARTPDQCAPAAAFVPQ